jgi:hypothetical protein
MNFLYYAYVGVCTLYDGFDFNKPIQLSATAPTTSAWDHRHTSAAVSNWFDDIYLNLHHSDPHNCPRFTESGLTTDPFVSRAPCINPLPPRLLRTSRSDRKAAYSPQIPLVYQFLFITTPSLPLSTHDYTFLLFPQPPSPALPQPLRSVLHTCTSQT